MASWTLRSIYQTALATAIATPMIALSAMSAKAGGAVQFTLVNGTSSIMTSFYAAPPDATTWEEDILGADVLAPGESVTITIDDGRDTCDYEFRAEWKNADPTETAGSVCDGGTYTYTD